MNSFERRYTKDVPRSARPMPLITGMQMKREEFLRRWESLPELKLAELIEGIVFVPSPIGLRHSDYDVQVQLWLATYAAHTPGVAAGTKATCYMLESAPQPDAFLRILPEHGGSTQDHTNFLHGAPELIVEISESSTAYDFGPKLALYQRAGVREYITLDTSSKQITWRVLTGGSYRRRSRGIDWIYRSKAFPGLWLDPRHIWSCEGRSMLAVLQKGIDSEEHRAFVARMKK
jgi:Uma2 family endonuclease